MAFTWTKFLLIRQKLQTHNKQPILGLHYIFLYTLYKKEIFIQFWGDMRMGLFRIKIYILLEGENQSFDSWKVNRKKEGKRQHQLNLYKICYFWPIVMKLDQYYLLLKEEVTLSKFHDDKEKIADFLVWDNFRVFLLLCLYNISKILRFSSYSVKNFTMLFKLMKRGNCW